jgi:hypothetical protein
MKRYKGISVDYGVNTELMESYEQMLSMEEEEDYAEIAGMESINDLDTTKMMEVEADE